MKISIRTKIISGFATVFAISMIIGVYGFNSVRRISIMSQEQTKLQDAEASILSVLSAHYTWRQDLSISVFTSTEFTGSYDPSSCALGRWRNSEAATEIANDEIKALLNRVDESHNFIHNNAETIIGMIKSGDEEQIEQARSEFIQKLLPKADETISILAAMTDKYKDLLSGHTININRYEQNVEMVLIMLIAIGTVLCIILSLILLKSIMKPLKTLANSADTVARGNLSVNFSYNVNDEIGMLTRNFASLVDIFKQLTYDLTKMAEQHSIGETGYFIQSEKYHGEFQSVADGINAMIKEYLANVDAILDITDRYASGDFSARLEPLPGKKGQANIVLDNVSGNLRSVGESISFLVESALAGELDKRVEDSGFKGDWKNIIISLNMLLESVYAPIKETQNALSLVSKGIMNTKMTGKYRGQFKEMGDSINRTIEVMSDYIQDISHLLNELASDNFNVEVTKDYIGSFKAIKTSLNTIINRLNNVMEDIGNSTMQVTVAAKQFSEASMTLAHGAAEQASAIEELNASIDLIHDQTQINSENSTAANSLADEAKKNAEHGNVEMNAMLDSMRGINDASYNISKIIKVIEDIAFQTNLLALNAAVEAARAGEHGKGFSVVAEEVRSLAARSQNAAKETTALIEQSITKVDEGTNVSNNTAQALLTIVDGVTNVSGIINKIEESAKEQASSITQMQIGIGQISEVTQQNSATSQESAAAAQELSSQSEVLKSMIAKFKLKPKSRNR